MVEVPEPKVYRRLHKTIWAYVHVHAYYITLILLIIYLQIFEEISLNFPKFIKLKLFRISLKLF